MVENRRLAKWLTSFHLLLVLAAPPALGQTLVITQPHAGDGVVTGQATPGSGPLTIYDASFPAPAPLGRENSMDASGNFAVSVNPALILGNTIIAEDAAGNQSGPVTVIDPPAPLVE